MIWEVEILPKGRDAERERAAAELDLLTSGKDGKSVFAKTSRGYLLEGNITRDAARQVADRLLVDVLVEEGRLGSLNENLSYPSSVATVLLKPGVMDPAAQSVSDAARDLGISVDEVRTFRRYYLSSDARRDVVRKVLANDAIEQLIIGPLATEHLALGKP